MSLPGGTDENYYEHERGWLIRTRYENGTCQIRNRPASHYTRFSVRYVFYKLSL